MTLSTHQQKLLDDTVMELAKFPVDITSNQLDELIRATAHHIRGLPRQHIAAHIVCISIIAVRELNKNKETGRIIT